ncbi:serine hydrolase [Arenibacter sp. GZD96]|uniref:serine hydrolase domain-containing protein n=1 Tax=Aurantibrevibacter litoralis TaxID=3106030 RepID=UPI002AFFC4A6|nr:serine hydrolase [Arenibacter sp. GZD-96]MEA1785332.1 serine hydrolase [Arenibacter sp. GZD-96]
MKLLKRLLLVLGLLLVLAIIYNYPKLHIISGFAAKNMASTVFIAKRSVESINKNDHNVPLIKLANSEVDKENQKASASVFGLMKREAVYRDGLGAVLLNSHDTLVNSTPNRTPVRRDAPFPYGQGEPRDTIFENVDYPMLEAAIGKAFSDSETQKTRTVLVLYKDRIIAEHYTDGFTKNTPILGWSATKSVLATLYGILEYQGTLNVTQTASIEAWKNDNRRQITLNHLLRMQSGLAWDEDYAAISDVTKMLFLDGDMSLAQKNKQAIAKPGEKWNYSSGTSNLLSGILRQQFKSHQAYLDFPYHALIDKIGMHSMLLETDMVGNFVGSSYAWATTRDWAKFGLLYLHKGNWNGEQLFKPSWVAYVTQPTEHSNGTYGAHFWLNAHGKFPDVPRDMYSANGYQGQYVFIIPSKEVVVVRTGLAENPKFDVNLFLKDILAAIH